MTSAEIILDQALADPQAALEDARRYLRRAEPDDHAGRAVTYRAMSLASRFTHQFEDSIEYARLSAESAALGGDAGLRLLALLTLSGSMAISGDAGAALGIVESALETCDDRHLGAKFAFQRGALLELLGRLDESLTALDGALSVFEEIQDSESIGAVLRTRSLVRTSLGRLDEAETDIVRAIEIAHDLGRTAILAGLEHNLGRLHAHRGDIPTALLWLTRSDEREMMISGAPAPQHVARCEVLISAGLFREALLLAKRIAAANHTTRDEEHEAEALLVASNAALLASMFEDARSLAESAMDLYERQGALSKELEARRILTEARWLAEGATRELLTTAHQIAVELESAGVSVAAAQAHLLAGRIALDIEDLATATGLLEPVASVNAGPVELRIQGRLARGLLHRARGQRAAADAAARSGLRLIDRYQAALGATDLRMGIERHGADLARIGLGLALDSRRPRRVLAWMERTRGRALRHRPVVPTGDEETRQILGNLRRIESELRNPEKRGDRDLLRQRRRLQEQISNADRIRRGNDSADSGFGVDRLVESLGERSLVEIGTHDGGLFAVVVRRGRARLIDLGPFEEALAELSHIRFSMRRAARMGRDIDDAAIHRLDRLLLHGVRTLDDEVVLIPPPELMAAPWAVMPTFHGRAVSVSPSAEMWWRAHTATPVDGSVLVAAGPDLDVAAAEVEAVASLYGEATVLLPGTTVDQVRDGLDGAAVAHIVSHATFQAQNPMFSSLRLGDGDLNVYDLERMQRAPALVVLSACDSGYTEAWSGDELAGLTSALLSMGSRNVVASVGLVPDSEATSRLMVRFHRGLIGGRGVAEALSGAQAETADDSAGFIAAASFVCVGG